MHAGSITNDLTAAARVYAALRGANGRWLNGYELQDEARTTAVSTRVSEVRRQLPAGEEIEMKQEGRRFYYRLTRVPKTVGVGQMALM